VQTFNFFDWRKDFSTAAERRRRVARGASPWSRSRGTRRQAPDKGRHQRSSNLASIDRSRNVAPLRGLNSISWCDRDLGLTPPGYTTRPLPGPRPSSGLIPWLRPMAALSLSAVRLRHFEMVGAISHRFLSHREDDTGDDGEKPPASGGFLAARVRRTVRGESLGIAIQPATLGNRPSMPAQIRKAR